MKEAKEIPVSLLRALRARSKQNEYDDSTIRLVLRTEGWQKGGTKSIDSNRFILDVSIAEFVEALPYPVAERLHKALQEILSK